VESSSTESKLVDDPSMTTEPVKPTDARCGFVAILGRPNVGKSTLLNHLLGQKVSITSRRPQTTRHRLLGIWTEAETQVIYVDTPGIHRDEPRVINRYMNRAAATATNEVDLILFVIEALKFSDDDQFVLDKLKHTNTPIILVINKIDKLGNKEMLLPFIERVAALHPFVAVVPLCALRRAELTGLQQEIVQRIPQGKHFYDDDQITDRSMRFMAAELIREKVMRQLGQEVPYSLAVEIEQFRQEGRCWHIYALILVEKAGQKNIVIGKQGQRLKQIGADARIDIEKMLEAKVMLHLWVKVRSGWADDERALRSLGYDE
jgi:GTP-binding protein Era